MEKTYHFEAIANNKLYTFHQECNKISLRFEHYIAFVHVYENGEERLLGMLPHASIIEILSIED